jgi:hypothetical protein
VVADLDAEGLPAGYHPDEQQPPWRGESDRVESGQLSQAVLMWVSAVVVALNAQTLRRLRLSQ